MTSARQSWLRSNEVEDDLIELAKIAITCASVGDKIVIRKRLCESFTTSTGEDGKTGKIFIDKVVAAMVKGYNATIPRKQLPAVAMTQHAISVVTNGMPNKLTQVKSSDPLLQITHTKRVESLLSTILAFRVLASSTAREQMLRLLQQIESGGEFENTIEPLKNKVRYWAARLCAQNPDFVEKAKSIRSTLVDDHCDQSLIVIDAFIASNSGDRDRALLLVNGVEEPDARTVYFSLLCDRDGENDALFWCKGIDPETNHSYFTHLGWKNWAIANA